MVVSEVVSKMVSPSERFLGSRAFRVVAREWVLLGGMEVLVVTFEIGWATKDRLFPLTSTWIFAMKLALIVAPSEV